MSGKKKKIHFSEDLEVQFLSNLRREKKSIKIDSRDKSLTQNMS